jgi:glycosyltransferase involved in cell wall biosynthesis
MKTAVVHDYFTQMGGAERVAEELCQMLPEATLVTLVAFQAMMPDTLKTFPLQTSWIQSLPGLEKYYRLFFMLYPYAATSLDLSEYDLVVSSSSSYAKGIRAGNNTMHVCYCHTPTRWVWSFDSYSQREGMSPAVKASTEKLIHLLKDWDISAAQQPDHFIANSQATAKRILQAYGRTAEIIHPPINVDRFTLNEGNSHGYYLVLSRLVSYKRIDLAVEACSRLNRKLLIVGDGPHKQALMAGAAPCVTFCGRLPDPVVDELIASSRALIFPGEEDFGMTPLELAASGRPTIAYRAGGALETVIDGVTGTFFDQQTPEHLMEAIEASEKQTFCPTVLRQHAEKFSSSVFRSRMAAFLDRVGTPITLPFMAPRASLAGRPLKP